MPGRKRILLIEDNDGDVFLIEKALAATARPLDTSHFGDGAEALSVLLAMAPAELPDAILLDLNMPRSDGMDILRQIRSSPRLTDIPVGILTGSVSSSDRQRALTNGAARYIYKAASLDSFISNVSQAVTEMLGDRANSAFR